jgi:hypothetical protein
MMLSSALTAPGLAGDDDFSRRLDPQVNPREYLKRSAPAPKTRHPSNSRTASLIASTHRGVSLSYGAARRPGCRRGESAPKRYRKRLGEDRVGTSVR